MLFLLALTTVVHAETFFTVDIVPVKNQILYTETAEYQIRVTNKVNVLQSFELATPLLNQWSFQTDPTHVISSFTIKRKEAFTFTLYVSPLTIEMPAKYIVPIKIKTKTETEERDIEVFMKNPVTGYIGYTPSISVDVHSPKKINPSEVTPINIELTNRNVLDIKEAIIEIKSAVYNGTQTTTLGPLERKTITFETSYDPALTPREEFFTVQVTADGNALSPLRQPFEIMPYSSIEQTQTTRKEMFNTIIEIELFNKGNVEAEHEVTVQTTFFKQFFTKLSIPSEGVQRDQQRYVIGTLTLQPQEKRKVIASENYRPLIVVVLFAILGLCLYFLFRSPLVLRKKMLLHQRDDHDHPHIKVKLYVKNRTRRIVESVTVYDPLLAVVQFETTSSPGSVKPDKIIKNAKQETVLKWDIYHLEPFEERIITYTVKARIHILGALEAPAAFVKYKNQRNTLSRTYSNKTSVQL